MTAIIKSAIAARHSNTLYTIATVLRAIFKPAVGALAAIGIPMALVYLVGAWIESLRGAML